MRRVGVVTNTQYGGPITLAVIGNPVARSAIVSEARKHGGHAVVVLDSSQRIVGYSESYAGSYSQAVV